jgi:hypothetical protein
MKESNDQILLEPRSLMQDGVANQSGVMGAISLTALLAARGSGGGGTTASEGGASMPAPRFAPFWSEKY